MSTKSGVKVIMAVLTVVLVFVVSIAGAETATVTLKSPNGGEILAAGSTYTVSWTYTGDPGATVNLALLQAGK